MTAFAAALAERALRPLDEVRAVGLRALAAGGPSARALLRRRSTRVPVLLAAHALGALVLAVLAPPFLLVAGPLTLGVPHLAADVRHLVLRRAWPRWWLAATILFAAALLAARLLVVAGTAGAPSPTFEQGLGASWIVFAAATGALFNPRRRRDWFAGAPAVGAALAIAALALLRPRAFSIALVHGHNLVAIALWLWLFRRANRLVWLPVALVVAAAAVLASGVLIPFTVRHGALVFADLHLFAAADWLAPGLPDATAVALAMSFAFLQSAHYAIWLAGVPASDRPGEGGRSLRAAAREFARDFRPAGVAAVVLLAAAVAGLGLFHPGEARRLVLSLGMFHAWLELAVLAHVLAAGSFAPRRPRA